MPGRTLLKVGRLHCDLLDPSADRSRCLVFLFSDMLLLADASNRVRTSSGPWWMREHAGTWQPPTVLENGQLLSGAARPVLYKGSFKLRDLTFIAVDQTADRAETGRHGIEVVGHEDVLVLSAG